MISLLEGLEEPKSIQIDLEGVSSLDISAAQELLEFIKDSKAKSVSIILSNPRPAVMQTLERTGVTSALAEQ